MSGFSWFIISIVTFLCGLGIGMIMSSIGEDEVEEEKEDE